MRMISCSINIFDQEQEIYYTTDKSFHLLDTVLLDHLAETIVDCARRKNITEIALSGPCDAYLVHYVEEIQRLYDEPDELIFYINGEKYPKGENNG